MTNLTVSIKVAGRVLDIPVQSRRVPNRDLSWGVLYYRPYLIHLCVDGDWAFAEFLHTYRHELGHLFLRETGRSPSEQGQNDLADVYCAEEFINIGLDYFEFLLENSESIVQTARKMFDELAPVDPESSNAVERNIDRKLAKCLAVVAGG